MSEEIERLLNELLGLTKDKQCKKLIYKIGYLLEVEENSQ